MGECNMGVIDDNRVQNYINNICSKVKNKRVHKEIKDELIAHIQEMSSEYISSGMNKEEAVSKALKEMGAWETVGEDLNKVHKQNPEWSVISLSVIMVLIGIGMMYLLYLTGYFKSIYSENGYRLVTRTVIWSTLSIGVLIGACFIDYRKLKNYSKYLYITAIISIILALCFSPVNGIRLWIQLSYLTFNVGQLAPILLIIALAGFYNNYDWNSKFNIVKGITLGILPIIFLMLTGDASSCMIYGISVIVLLFLNKANKVIVSIFACMGIGAILISKTTNSIIKGFLSNDANGAGFIYSRLEIVRSSAVLFGKAKEFNNQILPESYTDFMFASIVYNLGWIAGALVVVLISVFLFKVVKIALATKNNYAKTLVLGLTSLLGAQFVLNIFMNLGMFPAIGVAMPFVSYGGTSVITNMFVIGIIINVYRGRTISKIEAN
jgi:cell division protein FtsW (lipid II flippase)